MEAIIAPKTKKPAAKKTAVKKPDAKAKNEKTAVKDIATEKAPSTLDMVMKALDQEKGQDVVTIDLRGKTAIADHMVVVSGTSSRQVSAMAENICGKLAKQKIRTRIEGKDTGDWVVVDAGDVIIHLFRPEVREFYNLEKLWGSDFTAVGYNLYTAK